jgi:hypothetical protein
MNINEIITVDELVQPSKELIATIDELTTNEVENNIYYGRSGEQLIVAYKSNRRLVGYVIGVRQEYHNITYMIPRNIYSWANDNGKTALLLLKTLISISKPMPVLSDIQMSRQAKRFIEKNIDSGHITAEIFDLKTGDVTAYDTDIWKTDDDRRVLIMEQHFRSHPTALSENLIMPFSGWNWHTVFTKV